MLNMSTVRTSHISAFNLHLPDVLIICASSLATIQPRLRILLCLLYGRYGTTPMIRRADDVLNAYAIINISITSLLTFLQATVN